MSAVVRFLTERGGAGQIAAIAVRRADHLRHEMHAGVEMLTDPVALGTVDAGLVV